MEAPSLRNRLAALGAIFLALASCSRSGSDGLSDQKPAAETKIRLLVIGDPAIADAVGRLKGEWNSQTGSILDVQQASPHDPAASNPAADVVICPSHHLAALAENNRIIPIPMELIQKNTGENSSGNWNDFFPLLRGREADWAGKIVAVPLGSPVLTCYYRADLLEKLAARPPRTWDEYRKLAQLLADRTKLGSAAPPANRPWFGSLEPLGPGWAGTTLLARAACYATHHDNYSTLFNIASMQPLIDGPPFVRALEELVAVASPGDRGQLQYDPAGVRAMFWQGRCGLALTWPTRVTKIPPVEDRGARVGFAELPGSSDVYNLDGQAWESRSVEEDGRVPLLGSAGRLGCVTTEAESPELAVRLLLWLSQDQAIGQQQVSSRSPDTTLFRQSQARSAINWVEEPVSPAVAAQYAALIGDTLSRQQWLLDLRIPGRSEYLAALDEAVAVAVQGTKTPREALHQTAAKWHSITQRLGLDGQRNAYRHSLGLE